MNAVLRDGWERLPNGYDVEFRHSIPVRLSDNGMNPVIPESTLVKVITELGGLHLKLGKWVPGEKPNEHEAQLLVSKDEIAGVLDRLAISSATVFFDRFHKPIDKDDVDWDRLEYLDDFGIALTCCGLGWGDADMDTYRKGYLETMHQETRRLAELSQTADSE